ncbi:MAG: peptidylprolyl isomerase [Gemmatimonadetes bacterium]|nr:peptidylprolyl isomerase [Gemmatimonadota bacterium]
MRKVVAFIALTAAAAFAACESFGQAMTSHTDVVARAAGLELTVDETAALLAHNPRLPAQAEVVEAIANLWVDYVLLATAVTKDTALASVSVEPLIKPFLEQEVVWKLRDKVIKADTLLDDAELRALYEAQKPGLQVRARHILLRLPADATPAQRDSLTALSKELRSRAAAGADFAKLASEYSQDPGSAQQGGDLGFFARGQMVAPFEEAAFALEPGQVSEVVESPFGLHIIKVEERKLPDFEQVKESFREQAKVERQLKAEEAYITQLTEPRNIEVEEDALDVARELAKKPAMDLGGRAASRTLVSYKGGAFTAGEFQDLMRRFQPSQRARYASANDEQLDAVLNGMARNEILVEEAKKQGLEVTPVERDSLAREARRQLESAVVAAQLKNIQPQEGETLPQAIERKVNALLEGIIKGERNVLPLGPIAYALREQFGAQIFDRAFPAVVAKAEASRPATPPTPGVPGAAPATPAQPAPQPPADTSTKPHK